MKNLVVTAIVLILIFPLCRAQIAALPGTYMNSANTMTLRLKAAGNTYHGVLQTADGIFALRANFTDGQLAGTVFTPGGNIEFSGKAMAGGLSLTAWGYTEVLHRFSDNHELAGVDLTPYMIDRPPLNTNGGADYDYSYSQQSNGNYSEQHQIYPNTQPPAFRG